MTLIDSIKNKIIPKFRARRSSGSFTTQKQWIDTSKITIDLLDELYTRNGLANKIVRRLTRDRFDKWYDPITDNEALKNQLVLLNSDKPDGLHIRSVFKLARSFAMRHGYSVIYLDYIDQGDTIADPVENPRQIRNLRILKKTDINQIILDNDINSPTYGEIEYYILNSKVTGETGVRVHVSRTIQIKNGDTLDIQGISLYLPMYNWLDIFDTNAWSIGQSFFRNAGGFPVITVKGWSNLDDDAQEGYMNQWKNVNSMVGYVLGDGDTIKFEGAAGKALSPKEYFEAGLSLVAAAGDLPYALLIGVNAGAVSGSETNLKDYYSDVSSAQTLEEQPVLDQMYEKLIETGQLSSIEFGYGWNSLFEENPTEKSTADKLESEAREIQERTGLRTLETQTMIDNGELLVIEKPTPVNTFNPFEPQNNQTENEDKYHDCGYSHYPQSSDAKTPKIEKLNGKKLVSEFSKPRFAAFEDRYYRELKKVFDKMQTASIQIARGFFSGTDAITGKNYNTLIKSIDTVIKQNKKDFIPIVKTNIGKGYDLGVNTAGKTLSLDLTVPNSVKVDSTGIIVGEHNKVLETLADDINKDIAVQLGIAGLNPVEKFSEIEKLIKNTFTSKDARLKMGVTNETNSALNQGNLAGFETSGVVVGKIWVSVVDGVTTDTCIGLNGEVAAIGESFSTGDFAPPASVPPHPCRSSLEPITAAQAQTLNLPLSDSIMKLARQITDNKNNQLDSKLKQKELDVLENKARLIKELEKDMTDQEYKCECIKCDYTTTSDKHCNDIKCPKCGGQMRRAERPGPGRS